MMRRELHRMTYEEMEAQLGVEQTRSSDMLHAFEISEKNSIGIETLYQLGYRIVHAKNIGTASSVLKKMKDGKAVLRDDILSAFNALQYAPLSQDQTVKIPTGKWPAKESLND